MKKYWRTFLLLLVILLTAGLLIFLGMRYYKHFMAKKTNQVDLSQIYPDASEDKLITFYNDDLVEDDMFALKHNNSFYLPLSLVMNYLTEDLFYDDAEKILTYTGSHNVTRFQTDELTYYVNNQPLTLQIALTELRDGKPFLPIELVEKFVSLKFTYNENYHTLLIQDPTIARKYGIVELGKNKKEYIRQEAQKKAPYIRDVYEGMELVILEELQDYYKVITDEGFYGYVPKEIISSVQESFTIGKNLQSYTGLPSSNIEGKVALVWHQVFNTTANNSIKDRMADTRGVNVISPTWFEIADEDANIKSLADLSYVRWAHNNGYQVWPLFSNAFDKTLTHEVLKSTEKRDQLIRQILAFTQIYELDGINIDFENVGSADGENFVQFVKELSIYLKQQGLVVSVDMYVPKPWTEHYGRAEIGKYIDYLIIMGYDEHWSTSPKSGSVASLDFVKEGVVETLKSLPKEKVILAVPFYTRLWKETGEADNLKVSSKAYGMGGGKKILDENADNIVWLDEIGQYYGEYTKDGAKYRMWLEDKRSLNEKLKIAHEYDLAGMAAWKLGLENKEAWEAIADYLEK